MNHPKTTALLRVLATLDEDCLVNCYGIIREDREDGTEPAPLDEAVYAWRDAGCPDAKPSPVTPEDAARGYGVEPDEDGP